MISDPYIIVKFPLELVITGDMFTEPVPYTIQLPVIESCGCGQELCTTAQLQGYFILIMDMGADHQVTWWLSRN